MLKETSKNYNLTEDEVHQACLFFVVAKGGAVSPEGAVVEFDSDLTVDKVRKTAEFMGVTVTISHTEDVELT